MTSDLISEDFIDKHDVICKMVDFRASYETKYRQLKNSWMFVDLMDKIYQQYRAEEIADPLSQMELLDDNMCEDGEREKLRQICSILYRHVIDDLDLQDVVLNPQTAIPEMVSRRFFINFLLLWAD